MLRFANGAQASESRGEKKTAPNLSTGVLDFPPPYGGVVHFCVERG